jgi:dihydropteroate synthase
MFWQTTRHRIDLTRVQIMAVVNVTPDSFSDGGRFANASEAAVQCERMLGNGADILDLGAESSRPGAKSISLQEELDRLLPVLEAALTLGCPVSIDTTKPEVMRHVVAMGADIINDINSLQAPNALDIVALHPTCGVALMHMRGRPETMQQQPVYDDVVGEVSGFLHARLAAASRAGISAERVVLDPGIGFGKSVEHNLDLLRRQRELLVLGRPLLVGWSRKSTLGAVTGRGVGDRLTASVAAALAAVQNGAKVIRVHDVAATSDALRVWRAAGLCQ